MAYETVGSTKGEDWRIWASYFETLFLSFSIEAKTKSVSYIRGQKNIVYKLTRGQIVVAEYWHPVFPQASPLERS